MFVKLEPFVAIVFFEQLPFLKRGFVHHLRGDWYQSEVNQDAYKLQKRDGRSVPSKLLLTEIARHHPDRKQSQNYGNDFPRYLDDRVVGDLCSERHIFHKSQVTYHKPIIIFLFGDIVCNEIVEGWLVSCDNAISFFVKKPVLPFDGNPNFCYTYPICNSES